MRAAAPQRGDCSTRTVWHGTPSTAKSAHTQILNADNRVDFDPITTRCLRAVFDASSDGVTYAAVALQEWEVYSTRSRRPSVKGLASVNCS
jgi:hypothetical protein